MNESSVGEHRLVSEQKLISWTWLGKTIRARDGERAVMFLDENQNRRLQSRSLTSRTNLLCIIRWKRSHPLSLSPALL